MIAFKCLKSSIQEKKYHGLAYIEEAIDGLARDRKSAERPAVVPHELRKVRERTDALLTWIHEHKIVETIYQKANMRQELIARSKKILRFLAAENRLQVMHVSMILQGVRQTCMSVTGTCAGPCTTR